MIRENIVLSIWILKIKNIYSVALFVSAWIETANVTLILGCPVCRTLRECVD